MSGEKIVVIDSDPEAVDELKPHLLEHAYDVTVARTWEQAVHLIPKESPDLIILELALPDVNGLEICRFLRQSSSTPILFLSSQKDDSVIIEALDQGADEYMTKPYNPGQLLARIRALLRRCSIRTSNSGENRVIRFPGLSIDLASHMVEAQGETVSLSAKEFALLSLLASNPNHVFRIEELFEKVWSVDSLGDPRTLIVHVSNLRKKIEPNPADPKYIITVRGVGYKFNG
ncbi:response regulator transcription factor [Paenibacillus larvae]|uniref:Transcriptional regulatory protein ResD n=1 Tax=Paenibacillus larvae subsp. larvae DSM 25430 TaxID=697284 RepID=V9W2I4_9BACL|nr:response regulator transcription factor [Paenibacillus larvae]AHD04169.1 transcriptional regulatory protein ResD [Paenibacillus larvae subsp. larvae DSM 25430]AVG10778.1 transcriptional regulatory protein ResD [Paenibacillus larvae subsp. larvae DSM 25430]MDR5567430.1 response regulator transcription factor [Paenibacillus larvae]MDR5594564.1 response regulator transcription factor [Paenibacillus larvae]